MSAIKTRREAQIWVYRELVAPSLRKRVASLNDGGVLNLPAGITPAGVRRVHKEMLRLAAQLEARAAKLQGAQEGP